VVCQETPAFPESHKLPENKVSGCVSQVYITANLADGKVLYPGDADTKLAGLKQISSPNKTQTGFVSREYVPIFVQPFDKPKRYGCPKRFKGFCKGV